MGSEQVSGVYAITHLLSGRSYIGSSRDIISRWAGHQNQLKANTHHSSYLQKAWNKYGSKAFCFVVLEPCAEAIRVQREQFWIDQIQAANREFGFNLSPMAHAACPGEEGRLNIAESNRRRTGTPWVPKDKDGWREKISAARSGKKYGKRDPRIGKKIAAALTGVSHSDERKKNISKSIMALSPEARSARAFKAWETKRAKKEVL
jgi:group I intron endonuclease